MDFHKQFLAFAEAALSSDVCDDEAPDLNQILATLAAGDDVHELMRRVPDEKIGEVLTWVMNVDLPSELEDPLQ